MTPQAAALVRSSRSNKIGDYLAKNQDAVGGLGGNVPPPEITGTGAFGNTVSFGSLPANPGPAGPPIVTQGGQYGGPYAGGGVDIPDLGPSSIPPGQVIAFGPGNDLLPAGYPISGAGGGPSGNQTGAGPVANAGGITFGPNGNLQGGINGPQGSVYGIDPNTGNPIYNVTGSPRPGFFDSRTGRVVSSLLSAGGNMLVPGAGTISKVIADYLRNRSNQQHTGTDLSGQNQQQSPSGPTQGPPSIPGGGALFGYNPAQGGGTPHYDPGTGRVTATPSLNPLYTQGGNWQSVANAPTDIRFSRNSGTGNFVADQTTKNFLAGGGYAGVPNQSGPDSTNRYFSRPGMHTHLDSTGNIMREPMTPEVGPAQAQTYGQPFQGTQRTPPPVSGGIAAQNEWLMHTPEYIKWLASRKSVPAPLAGPPMQIQPAGG